MKLKINESQLRRTINNILNGILNESFTSQKLKDAVKQHGGLSGDYGHSYFNDWHRMTDDDFDKYMEYDEDEYRRNAGKYMPGNVYSKPLKFNDGTFMIRRNPEIPNSNFGIDADTQKLNDLRSQRINSRGKANDGRYNYQYQNPYLDNLVNGFMKSSNPFYGYNPVRGKGNWFNNHKVNNGTELDPRAIRDIHSVNNEYSDDKSDILTKARKASTRLNESQLREVIRETIMNIFESMDEKAVSKAQQRFFGMVHAVQKGELDSDEVGDSVNKAAKSMTKKDVKDFAETKHKGLPNHVK